MKIVKATLDHLDQLVSLFDAYRVWYQMDSDKETAKSFLSNRIKNSESVIFLALTDDGKAVGFTQLYPLFSSVRMKPTWLLNDLFVASEYRGKGISKQLIDRAKGLARATQSVGVTLETEKSNTIGNQLYPRMGFELDDHNFYFWENNE
jgi:GNAT superfamily N-acetyltransferase